MRVKVLLVVLIVFVKYSVQRPLQSHPNNLSTGVYLFSSLFKELLYGIFQSLLFGLFLLYAHDCFLKWRLESGSDSGWQTWSYRLSIVHISHVVVLPLKVQELSSELSRLLQNLLRNCLLHNLKSIVCFLI